MSLPILAVVAAGAMGSAVGRRLTSAGLTVLTNLDGRSSATRSRAHEAGMQDTSLGDIASRANWVLSILPPSEAYAFAQRFRDAHSKEVGTRRLAFADCNAVNPETAKLIASVFVDTPIKFIDAGIIGGPPQGQYDPVFYASADVGDEDVLDEFAGLQVHGLKVKLLKGEGASVGDASALKMSYAVSCTSTYTAPKSELLDNPGHHKGHHWNMYYHDIMYIYYLFLLRKYVSDLGICSHFSCTCGIASNLTGTPTRACVLSARHTSAHCC